MRQSRRNIKKKIINKTIKRKRKRNIRIKTGGKVIGSGAYGCIFSPAIKCRDTPKHLKRETDKISKLMLKRDADNEFEKINLIKLKLDTIPNHQDYFVIDNITICEPANLQTADLVNFTSKCDNLIRNVGVHHSIINQALEQLRIINMKNAGIELDDYLYTNITMEKIYKLHISLVELLKNGIVPMNKLNVYHCDIKHSNILVEVVNKKTGELKTRLIDWGLATEYKPFENNPLPLVWKNRPLQFNVPFSVILFTDAFTSRYNDFIKNGGNLNEEELKPFVKDYIKFWVNGPGKGQNNHYKFINETMKMIFIDGLDDVEEDKKDEVLENEITKPIIEEYIINVLVYFTKFKEDGTFDLTYYIDNIFIKIVDIWGFIESYNPILAILSQNYDKLTPEMKKVFKQLQFIYNEYLYSLKPEPINIDKLYSSLDVMQQLLHIVIYGKPDENLKSIDGLPKAAATPPKAAATPPKAAATPLSNEDIEIPKIKTPETI